MDVLPIGEPMLQDEMANLMTNRESTTTHGIRLLNTDVRTLVVEDEYSRDVGTEVSSDNSKAKTLGNLFYRNWGNLNSKHR